MRFKLIYFSASLLLMLAAELVSAQDKPWKNLGRIATADEVRAWDIDVRGDFKGLPKGQGTVAQGEQIWEAKCASCHGTFGELNEVFPPLVGGTTAEDIKRGIVAANEKGGVAQRTTMMKLAKLSTLWDYINRAMPWNAPKSLQTDEVYAVIAYLLNLSAVVPEDFSLSNDNIEQVQNRLPNRNGLVRFDGLWLTQGKADTSNIACMKNCATETISSSLPDFARNAHGNLAEQNRLVGAVRGADTTVPAANKLSQTKTPVQAAAMESTSTLDVKAILTKNACTACHGINKQIVGPGFDAIAAKYKTKAGAEDYLANKIKTGGSGSWGSIPMPPQTQLKENEVRAIATWLIAGAKL